MHISETTLKSARGELGIREWPQRVHTCYNTLKERYTQVGPGYTQVGPGYMQVVPGWGLLPATVL